MFFLTANAFYRIGEKQPVAVTVEIDAPHAIHPKSRLGISFRISPDDLHAIRRNRLAHIVNDISTDRTYIKQGAQRESDFIGIVAWRSTAEFICKYFRKGQMMAVQGQIQTRSYTDKDGNKRKAFEVVAENVSFTESRKKDGESREKSRSGSPDVETDDFEELPTDDDLPF